MVHRKFTLVASNSYVGFRLHSWQMQGFGCRTLKWQNSFFLLVLISEIFKASRFCSLISEHRDFAALFVFHVRRLNYRIMVIGLKNRYECRESSARDVRGFGFRTPTEYYEFQHLNSWIWKECVNCKHPSPEKTTSINLVLINNPSSSFSSFF